MDRLESHYWLCDLGQVTQPLQGSNSSPAEWEPGGSFSAAAAALMIQVSAHVIVAIIINVCCWLIESIPLPPKLASLSDPSASHPQGRSGSIWELAPREHLEKGAPSKEEVCRGSHKSGGAEARTLGWGWVLKSLCTTRKGRPALSPAGKQ